MYQHAEQPYIFLLYAKNWVNRHVGFNNIQEPIAGIQAQALFKQVVNIALHCYLIPEWHGMILHCKFHMFTPLSFVVNNSIFDAETLTCQLSINFLLL